MQSKLGVPGAGAGAAFETAEEVLHPVALTGVGGLPIKLSLSERHAYEGHHVIELFDDPRGLMVAGNTGFDDKLRQRLEVLSASHFFPGKSKHKHMRRREKKSCRRGYRVENFTV